MGLVDIPQFQSGSNDLSIPELKLAQAYSELCREDLADCVRGGKLHQRLWSCIGSRPTMGKVRGLADLAHWDNEEFKFERKEDMALELGDWCERMVGVYQKNEVLVRLMDDDLLSWKERCAIKEGVEGVVPSR